jgi:type IV pilus assembly protein PilM
VKRLEDFHLAEEGEALSYASEAEGKVAEELASKYLTVLPLDGKDVIVRKMKLKLLKEKDIEEAFPFEAENLIPYPIEQAVADKIYVEKQDDSTLLTLLASKKNSIQTLLEKYRALGIDPEVVTTTPHALSAFTQLYYPKTEEVAVLLIGLWTSALALVKNGKLISSHSLNTGTENLKRAYKSDQEKEPEILTNPFNQIDFSGEDLPLAPELAQAVAKLKQEISWIVLSELKNYKEAGELPLIFLGEGSVLKGLDKALFGDMNLTFAEMAQPEASDLNLQLLKRFAVSIGAALTALPKYPDPINFRQDDLAYQHPWKRFKAALMLFGISSLLLATMIFLFGQAYIGYREDGIRQTYVETLASLRKSYQETEKNFYMKQSGKKGESPESVPSVKSLSIGDIKDRLDFMDKEIKGEPDLFPLMPQVPLVSDVLAWLANHPKIKSEDGVLSIDNFSYTLVKRPEMTKKGEKYQVKIDLEVSSPTPKLAREFHNALIAPNDFVDPKAEVKWNATRGKYQTSFYLKDKTAYLQGGK